MTGKRISAVQQAMFEERRKLKGAADVFDDSAAVDAAQAGQNLPDRWERLYDALAR
ncbi:hypothetical protein [Paracoccus shanxieyensis]|uniref:Uncharacterized protein n=1 Tax=Paracoccus shanxieyensis TaxID=2675752 RepID=A0A6L6J1G1_9RHOB|nr:hypothetical protein [Paracoccus shanxieyensis]MTH65648.1 hypothetical protein [Paracoccus shanxieyensis]MTH88777.1 hypothetical protein [Paracoccus shanxieyensis]